ncbi:MAG: hypothetical protein ACKVP7_00225 [Hyphomicrobiaceae bacterium]
MVEVFWYRSKWELIAAAVAGIFWLSFYGFFWGVERTIKGAEKELVRELRSLDAQCTDPAARRQLEEAGWTVRVGSDGGCRLERPRR